MKVKYYLPLLSSIFIFTPLSAALPNSKVPPVSISLQKLDLDSQIQKSRDVLQHHSSDNPNVLNMFDETVIHWQEYYRQKNDPTSLASLLNALQFAAIKHEGQYRKDAAETPYIIHPIGVAKSLWLEGHVRSVNVLIAALLHDTLEDTDTTAEEIERLFGPRVRYTVEELTNDPNLSSDENKQRQVDHAPYLSLDAQLVKLADRLYNIRDLRNPPPSWTQQDVARYLDWGQKLLTALRGTNEWLEFYLEQEIDSQLYNQLIN